MQLMRYYDFFGIRKSEVDIITSERTAFISPYTPPPPAIVNLRLVIIVIYTLDLRSRNYGAPGHTGLFFLAW